MDQKITRYLNDGHIDVQTGLERTAGNEALFLRLLRKFLENDHFEALHRDIENGDLTEAEHHMHALKGVSGNLAMDGLYSLCCELDDVLKMNQRPDPAQMEVFDAEYALVEKTINGLEQVS